MKLLAFKMALVCAVFSGPLMSGGECADMWWDTNGVTAGSSGGTTAPGFWNSVNTNWSSSSTGNAATSGWISGQTAVFAAGTNATGISTINLTENLTLAGIRVEEGLWNVAGGGTTLSFSNNALAVNSAVNVHLDALYAPVDGVITKTGTGYFGSDRAQTSFAGKWVINAGNVEFATDTAIGVVPATTVADQITLDGGNIYSSVSRTFDAKRGITLGANGGGINLSGTFSTVTWQGPITGTSGGPLKLDFGAAVVLTNPSNNYDGNTILRGATLRLGAPNVIPDTSVVNFTLSGSKLQLNGYDETVKSLNGSLGSIELGERTLTLDNPAGEICGTPISASAGGKLVKNGTGAITLRGNSPNFLGEFILNDGTVGLDNNNAFGNAAGAEITINGGAFSPLENNITIASAVTASLNADFAVNNMFSPKPRNITISGPATMNANRTITVSGSGALVLADLRQSTAGLSVTKQGSGALELGGSTSATNRFTGDVHVLAGRLQVGSSGFIGTGNNTIHFAGGSFNTAASRSVLAGLGITNPIDVAADAAITTTSTVPLVEWHIASNTIGGSGKITFRNDAIAKNSHFMPQLSGSGATFAPGPIEIANGTDGTTALHSYNSTGTTQTFNQVISGNGSYTRNATAPDTGGTTVFTAANTYSGGTDVSRGTLLVNNTTGSGTGSGAVTVGLSGTLGGTGRIGGAVTNGGVISPGASIGTLIVNSSVSMSANSRLAIEVNEATADRLVVHGDLDLSAMEFLDVTGSGAGPWLIATYDGSLMGVFNQVTAGFVVDYATNGQILLNVAPPPGDYNRDGKVDAADYVVWRKSPDSHGGASTGYDTWRTNFGRSSNGGGGLTDEDIAVPEPAAFILLLGLSVLLLVRCRS